MWGKETEAGGGAFDSLPLSHPTWVRKRRSNPIHGAFYSEQLKLTVLLQGVQNINPQIIRRPSVFESFLLMNENLLLNSSRPCLPDYLFEFLYAISLIDKLVSCQWFLYHHEFKVRVGLIHSLKLCCAWLLKHVKTVLSVISHRFDVSAC